MANYIQKTAEKLDLAVNEITYLPGPEQRKAKSAFWTKFNDNPICDPEDVSLAVAIRFSGDGRLSRWWSTPGFRDWFQNKDEFRQRIEYLVNLSLDSIEDILLDPKAQTSARVNAAKLLMEVARKTPSKAQAEKYLDEKVAQMDRKQLEEYIQIRAAKLEPSMPTITESDSNILQKKD